MKRFDIVVAADERRGIAAGGDLPWHLPGDLAHFKRITSEAPAGTRNAVIMGRKTWESIPPKFRPLPRRLNVVLTRRADYAVPAGVLVAPDLDAALAAVSEGDQANDVARVFVVGGGQVYAEAIASPACERVYITRVLARYDCDTFFPAFEADYQLESVMSEGRDGEVAYRIEVWVHKPDAD